MQQVAQQWQASLLHSRTCHSTRQQSLPQPPAVDGMLPTQTSSICSQPITKRRLLERSVGITATFLAAIFTEGNTRSVQSWSPLTRLAASGRRSPGDIRWAASRFLRELPFRVPRKSVSSLSPAVAVGLATLPF